MDNTTLKKQGANGKNLAITDTKVAFTDPAEASIEAHNEVSKEDTTRLKIRNTCFQLEQALAEFEKESSLPNRDLQEKIRIQNMRVQLAAIREQIETLS